MKTSVLAQGETKRGVAMVVVCALFVGCGFVVLNLMPADLPGTKIPSQPATFTTSSGATPAAATPAAAPAVSDAGSPARPQPAAEPPKPLRSGVQTFGS